MGVSLYTSRLLLDVLGINDYGIYNVVGGIVLMLSFMNNVMAISVSRFLGLAMGEGEQNGIKNVFIASANLHLVLSIIMLVMLEILGNWYIPRYLNVPTQRLVATYYVYHFSVLTMMINIIRVPLVASVTISEDMDVFALISILESVLKLVAVVMLYFFAVDKLILYGISIFGITFLITILYCVYCRWKYSWCQFRFYWDKNVYAKILRFAGLNTFGNMVGVIVDNGQNLLLNIFFGPAVNAARGIACQVDSAMKGFIGNVFTAVNPQIFKSYGERNYDYIKKILVHSARLSFSLFLFLCLPIMLNMDYVLHLWLKLVPEYTSDFVILLLINSLVYANSQPLLVAIHATGRIGKLHLYTGLVNSSSLVISFLLLKYSYPPHVVFIVQLFVNMGMICVILSQMRRTLGFGIVQYLREVYLREILVLLFSLPFPFWMSTCLDMSFISLIVLYLVSFIVISISTFFFCVNDEFKVKFFKIVKRYV